MIRRLLSITLLLAIAASPLSAGQRRASASPGLGEAQQVDALGVGAMSGAAISGTVSSVQGSLITLISGGAAPIRIDASTAKFAGERETTASIASVIPGARITAYINTTATTAAGAPLSAQLITVESSSDLTVVGAIQSMDVAGSRFTVLGITMAVDSATSYSSAFPTFAPIKGLADLAVGQAVSVAASFAGSNIVARRIQVLAPVTGRTRTLVGAVKSISATSWVITEKDGRDTTVTVDAQTKILGEPKVGDSVQVVANIDSSNNLVAIVIVKLPAAPETGRVELHGWVSSISPSQWTIGGPKGSLTPDTIVRIATTTVIYPDPKVGDKVVVVGNRDSTNVIVATKIALEK